MLNEAPPFCIIVLRIGVRESYIEFADDPLGDVQCVHIHPEVYGERPHDVQEARGGRSGAPHVAPIQVVALPYYSRILSSGDPVRSCVEPWIPSILAIHDTCCALVKLPVHSWNLGSNKVRAKA